MESTSAAKLQGIIGKLLSLNADDFQDLAQLHKELEEWARADDCRKVHRQCACQAAELIKQVILQEVSDGDGTLVRVAELLNKLQEIMVHPPGGDTEAQDLPQDAEAQQQPAETITSDEPETLQEDSDLDLLRDFVTESTEYLDNAEAALLTLETEPDDAEAINVIFRAFHTIKGTSAFLGLKRVSTLAHHAESMLSRARDGEIRCTGGYADLALRSNDMLKELMQGVQQAINGSPMPKPDRYDQLLTLLNDPEAAGITSESEDHIEPPRVGDLLVAGGKAQRDAIENAAKNQGQRPIGESIVRNKAASAGDVVTALRTQQRIIGAASESSVRVKTDRLDKLSDMVGELVIAQAMVSQDIKDISTDQRLVRNMNQLAKITRELQEVSMQMRMVPVRGVFQKMARLVRDLARKAEKEVDFVTTGSETELDRNMVEQIGDPLVHMIRNAVDHGIEPPADREAAGKPRTGRVELRAFHKAGNVVIEITDDGKGLNKERILQKAIAKGVVRDGADMTEQDIYRLIFHPGLSTAEKVTDISGRGVGMDVVRKNIESLRGRIEITSKPGVGSTFSIRLPLTLAVIDGQVVKVGQEQYIIPTIAIERCMRPNAEQLSTLQGRAEMVLVRGALLPLFRLYKLFNIEPQSENPAESLIVIVENNGDRCCLMVDELLGQQQVVIKNLGKSLGEIPGISGGAIMGNGNVSLILDVPGLIQQAVQETNLCEAVA